MAYKPGSVLLPKRGQRWPFIWDARCRAPRATYPAATRRLVFIHEAGSRNMPPCLVLLPVGLALPPPLPAARCALTAPFHPYPRTGGIFSVALSLRSPSPDVIRHRVLWSPDFPPRRLEAARRPSGHLTLRANMAAGFRVRQGEFSRRAEWTPAG